MSDREIFQINLNSLLESSGKSQRELADFVGVKKNTVSGWVHGVSYPRADAMERIAIFFSVKLSRLVEEQSEFVMNPQLFAANNDLTSDEHVLVNTYRSLPQEGKQYIQKQLTFATMEYGGKSEDLSSSRPG